MTGKPPPCPKCQGAAVPIAYGYPLPELFEAEERGEVHLGGCVVSEHMPAWHCRECGREFDEGQTPR